MFAKFFALFALVAVAMAAPSPKAAPAPAPAPAPEPQLLTYTAPLDYVYPASVPSVISPYAAAAPFAYSAYPGAYFLRR